MCEELKPCPFCGNKSIWLEDIDVRGMDRYYAICVTCGAKSGYEDTPEEATEKWNARGERTCLIADLNTGKSDQDSMQALRSKVKLQGEYISELSSKCRDLRAENNAMATRHLGQMDYVRRKLKAAVLDSGKCQFELVEPQVSFSKPMRGDRFRCTNCGCVCARGFIVDEHLDYCPKCKREIFK